MAVDRYGIHKIHNTVTNGTEWFARWETPRILSSNQHDEYDARVLVTCGSLSTQKFQIGGGIAQWITGSSPRLWIKGPWLNTEQTIYVKMPADSTTTSLQLRSRSNHNGADKLPFHDMGIDSSTGSDSISCGFGGYSVKWGEDLGDNLLSIEIEYIHGMYKRHVVDETFEVPRDQWVGFKNITRTDGSDVVVEGWNNIDEEDPIGGWEKTIEYTFDGSVDGDITQSTIDDHPDHVVWCADRGDLITADPTIAGISAFQTWNTPAFWNWFRVNNADRVSLRHYSVREITV